MPWLSLAQGGGFFLISSPSMSLALRRKSASEEGVEERALFSIAQGLLSSSSKKISEPEIDRALHPEEDLLVLVW